MAAAVTSPARASPFQGLRPYGEDDAEFFFGRDHETDVIIANLRASRLTVLYGASGVGKTSLLRAGVEARLRERASSNFERLGTPEFVPVVFDAWQDDPAPALARTITGEIGRWTGEPIKPAASLVEAITAGTERLDASLLLILDQFEDLSLYHGRRNGASSFSVEFPQLVNDRRLRVNVLVSIREDALAQLDRFKRTIPGLLDTRLRVPPLTGDAAREAVTGPIARFNELVEADAQVTLEDDLVDAVLGQVEIGKVRAKHSGQGQVAGAQRDASGSDGGANGAGDAHTHGVEASYLQLVMQRLWDHEIGSGSEVGAGARVLRLSALERLGGAQKIVREHLKDALSDLSRTQIDAAVDVLQYLVTPSGTKITQGLGTLSAWSGHPSDEVASLLERLQGDARIIRLVPPEPGAEENRYEIFHDVLAGAVLEWSAGENEKRRIAQLGQENERLAEQKAEAETVAARERRRRLFAVVLLVLALAGGVAAVVFWRSAVSQRNMANRERASANAETAVATYRGLAAGAQTMLPVRPDISVLLALQAYLHTPPHESQAVAKAALVAALDNIRRSGSRILHGHRDTVTSVALAPHANLLASASGDGTIGLWNTRTLKRTETLGRLHDPAVFSVSFSPDGRTLASAQSDGAVRLWNISSGRIVAQSFGLRPLGRAVITVAFSPDGRELAAANLAGEVGLWDVRDVQRLGFLRTLDDPLVRSVAFSRNSSLLAGVGQTSNTSGRIRLWTVANGRFVKDINAGRALYAVAFRPTGASIAAGGLDGRVWIVDPATGSRRPLGARGTAIDGIAISRSGQLAAALANGTVKLFDFDRGGLRVRSLTGHTGMATSVAFSDDGNTLASGSADQTIRLWNPHPRSFETMLARGASSITAVAFGSGMLAWARTDAQRHNAIELWDVTTHRVIHTIPTSNGIVRSLAFSPNGRLLASGSGGGAVWVWHVPDGRADRGSPLFLQRHVAINTVAFSPKGLLAFNAANGLLLVGNPITRKLRPIRASTYPLFAVAFNHDGTRLASGGDDRTIRVWDVGTLHLVRALAGHTDAVFALAFSPSSNLLASGSADNSIRIWNTSTGAPIGPAIIGHHGYVRTVAFSPDGLSLASGSADGTVKLWDVGGGKRPGGVELEDTLGPIGYVNGVVFSKDGNSLATASRDGAIRLWSPVGLPPTGVTSVVCGFVGDGLTPFERSRYAPGAYQDPCR